MATQDMTQPVIRCPECKAQIPLTKALTEELRDQLEGEYKAKLQGHLTAKADEYEVKLATEREKARQDVLQHQVVEHQAMQEEVSALQAELKQRRDAELKLLREKRELEAARATLTLEVERRVATERQLI